jgi:hypothetical protein
MTDLLDQYRQMRERVNRVRRDRLEETTAGGDRNRRQAPYET